MKKEIIPIQSTLPAKSISPEDITIVTPLKNMTYREMMEEMDKQGLRPPTAEDMLSIIKKTESTRPIRIEPKDTDIVIEKAQGEASKKLLPGK